MKGLIFALALSCLAPAALADTLKVVFHINERAKAQMLLNSINKLIDSEPDAQVQVIFHGGAIIRLSRQDGLSDDFLGLFEKGVVLGACSTSMLSNELAPDLMIEGVRYLSDGGVPALIDLQRQGYLYIKI